MPEPIATLFAPMTWVLDPTRSIYWPYLCAAVLLSVLVYACQPGASCRGLLRFLLAPKVWLHRSTLADLRFWLVDALLSGAFIAPLVLSSEAVADLVYAGLYASVGETLPVVAAGVGATLLFTLTIVIASDGSFFLSHWLRHRVPFLWEFHKVHHSAEVMTPITTFRSHPVDQLVSGSLAGIAVGAVVGAFDFVYAGQHGMISVWGANVLVFASNLLGGNLRHSHVPLRFGPWLDRVLISPAHHQLHHSVAPEHWDRNLGGLFAFWDGLAGTLVLPRAGQRLRFGIGDGSDREYHGVFRLYLWPWVRIVRGLRG